LASGRRPESRSAAHDRAWRDPAQIAGQWLGAAPPDPRLLETTVRGDWWGLLDALRITLLVTREYEHLVIAMSVQRGAPHISYLVLPHPCGLAVDPQTHVIHIASTRNPNVVIDLAPAVATGGRGGPAVATPRSARYYPGRLYLHDLAFVGGRLCGNAVGCNSVVLLRDDASWEHAWWPKAVDQRTEPAFDRNHLQLNSIAAGSDFESSFFSASTERIGSRKPGHRNFPADRRGVVFSGRTREPIVRGLTRPHSARLHRDTLWVDNSGYGEVGRVHAGAFEPVAKLPGWTRGLCFAGNVAIAGCSRVLPRFSQYAPGVDRRKSRCGLHAVDLKTGATLASLNWPAGNQIFAIGSVPSDAVAGFPFSASSRRSSVPFFYSYQEPE
jgi:uncharacterized protein (TIGR03032 family)